MKDRGLDGLYFRIKRDGRWGNVCFSDLTDEEMDEVLANRSDEWLKSVCKYLGKTLRRMGDELDVYGKDADADEEE